MDTDLIADLEAYRRRAAAWLDTHVAAFGPAAWRGSSEPEALEHGRRWQRTKADAGYAGIAMPVQYGGAGLSALQQATFVMEEIAREFPAHFFGISLGMPIPLMLHVGTEEQRRRFVPPALRGEEIWCQLFSEPAAGSDLAALRTRARPAEDGSGDWIVDGQKLWTSFAQYADFGIIVVRTDPSAPKHRGLTFFWIDMRAPGIAVRPVRLLNGEHDTNEVFFDAVRVPDANRIGAVGGGFGVAMQTLVIERYATGVDETGYGPPLRLFIEMAREAERRGRPAIEDGRVRAAIADNYALQAGLRAIRERAALMFAAGQEAGSEGALQKLASVRARQHLAETALDLLGCEGLAFGVGASPRSNWAASWLTAPTQRIAGGTDEILLNTIAERVLGLPQDHRPDKGRPFNAPA